MVLHEHPELQRAVSVDDLVIHMKEFNAEMARVLEGEKTRRRVAELNEMAGVEDELITLGIQQASATAGCRVESSIIHEKIAELVEKKELLSRMVKKVYDDFAAAKDKELYRDPKTRLTINDIFIDFLVNQCQNIDKRITELGGTLKLPEASSPEAARESLSPKIQPAGESAGGKCGTPKSGINIFHLAKPQ